MAALAAAALVIAGGAWWLLDSTVPVSDYDDVLAELDATREALASTQEALSAERSELGAIREALASTEEALSAEQSTTVAMIREFPAQCPVQVQLAAPVLGYFAGVDRSIVDPRQYESWSGVVELDGTVEALRDPALTELYWEHMDDGGFSPGSEELVLRLVELTIDPCLRHQ